MNLAYATGASVYIQGANINTSPLHRLRFATEDNFEIMKNPDPKVLQV